MISLLLFIASLGWAPDQSGGATPALTQPAGTPDKRTIAKIGIVVNQEKIKALGIEVKDVVAALDKFKKDHPKFKLSELRALKIMDTTGKAHEFSQILVDIEFEQIAPAPPPK